MPRVFNATELSENFAEVTMELEVELAEVAVEDETLVNCTADPFEDVWFAIIVFMDTLY